VKALILTGGQGTRLRPFTCSTPKPLLPLANIPFLEHQFHLLRRHGFREVTLATAYKPEGFRKAFGDGRAFGLKLSYAYEKTPLGTGGGVRNGCPDPRETLLVLNGDVLQDLDLSAFLRFHRAHKAEASIVLIRVKDPTPYGLVELDAKKRIRRFLEKPPPEEITTDTINAGTYLLEPSALLRIPRGEIYSMERGLFPSLLQAERPFYGFTTEGYWADIGTLEKYLQTHLDLLLGIAPLRVKGLRKKGPFFLEAGTKPPKPGTHEGEGGALLGRGTRVDPSARLRGCVCLGRDCVVGPQAVLEDCVLLDGCRVSAGARLTRCIIGRGCRIGECSVVGPGRALGDRTTLTEYSAA
jgi:NDP-sugar pyrophosphorylase family protein